MITNEQKEKFGTYCGEQTGKTVLVTGEYAIITFVSDFEVQRRGFLIFFSTVPHGKYSQSLCRLIVWYSVIVFRLGNFEFLSVQADYDIAT